MSSHSKLTILGTDLSKRIYGLDILRAYAVCLVLYVHTRQYLSQSVQNIIHYFICDGVTVFFTLSGFLIGNILIKTFEKNKLNKSTLINFWLNRWMRTLPLYYFILIISILLYDNTVTFSYIIKYIFFLQNVKIMIWDYFYSVSWSLSVEEWFYLLIPILLCIIAIFTRVKVKYSCLIVIVFVVLAVNTIRLHRYFDLVYNEGIDPNWYLFTDWYFRTPVITRLDSVMYGLLGAYFYSYYSTIWADQKKIKMVLGLVLIFLSSYLFKFILNSSTFLIYSNVFIFMIQGIGVMLLLPFFQSIQQGKGYIYKIVTTISLISYSIYLVHPLVIEYLIKPIGKEISLSNEFQFILIWIVTILISFFTYKYIEKPGIDLRKLFLKKE